MKDGLILLGKISVAMMAVITVLGFFGEPFLEDYVNNQIDIKLEEVDKGKPESFRTLLSKQMGVGKEEIHVRIGDMYKQEGTIKKEIKRFHRSTVLD